MENTSKNTGGIRRTTLDYLESQIDIWNRTATKKKAVITTWRKRVFFLVLLGTLCGLLSQQVLQIEGDPVPKESQSEKQKPNDIQSDIAPLNVAIVNDSIANDSSTVESSNTNANLAAENVALASDSTKITTSANEDDSAWNDNKDGTLDLHELLAIISALAIALSTFAGAQILTSDLEKEQIRTRAAAEAIKVQAYLYLMSAPPYSGKNPEQRLYKRVELILKDIADITPLISMTYKKGTPKYIWNNIITFGAVARENKKDVWVQKFDLEMTFNDYIEERVNGQINGYYLKKAAEFQRIIKRGNAWSLIFGFMGVGVGAIGATSANGAGASMWIAFLSTAGASIGSYLYSNKYEFLLMSYVSTASQLELMSAKHKSMVTPSEGRQHKFVAEVESVFAMEHNAWISEVSGSIDEDDDFQDMQEIAQVDINELLDKSTADLRKMVQNKTDQVTQSVQKSIEGTVGKAERKIEQTKKEVQKTIDDTKQQVKGTKDKVVVAVDDAKQKAEETISEVKNEAKQKVQETKDTIEHAVDDAKQKVEDTVAAAKKTVDDTTQKVNETKDTIEHAVDDAKQKVEDTVTAAKKTVDDTKQKVNETKDTIEHVVDDAKQKVEDTVTAAKKTVDDTTQKIKETKDAVEKTVDDVKQKVDKAKDAVEKTAKDISDNVEELNDSLKDKPSSSDTSTNQTK